MGTKFKVKLEDGVEVKKEGDEVIVKGEKGELKVPIKYNFLSVNIDADKRLIIVECKRDVDAQKEQAGTLAALIRNAIKGVKEGYKAELALVYEHFPASIKLQDNQLVVENFMGSRGKIIVPFPKDKVSVKVNGTNITVEGIDRYWVGQVAASFEQKVRPVGKDRRVFRDGIYIVKKP